MFSNTPSFSIGSGMTTGQPGSVSQGGSLFMNPTSTVSTTGLFPQQQTSSTLTIPSAFTGLTSQPQTSSVGLGGFSAPTASTPSNSLLSQPSLGGAGSSSDVLLTPKLTQLPPELLNIVELFKNQIKTQHDIAEEIATDDCSIKTKAVGENIKQVENDLAKIQSLLQKTSIDTRGLKEDSRQSLRSGEMAQRLNESPAYSYEYTVLLNYLHSMATSYERQLVNFAEQISFLEGLIAGKYARTLSLNDILIHLKRMDELYKHIASKVCEVHEAIKDVKEIFVYYRRNVFQDKTSYFSDNDYLKPHPVAPPVYRLEGPSPFAEASTGALLAMASALTRTQPTGGLGLNSSMSQQPFSGLGQQNPTQETSLFRPFTSTPATAAPTIFPSLSFTTTAPPSAFTVTTASSTTSAAAALPSSRFSSTFNTPSSGVLFGGSAAQNVGVVRPLGSAPPVQQTDASATLSLLKTPLGVKRGKTT